MVFKCSMLSTAPLHVPCWHAMRRAATHGCTCSSMPTVIKAYRIVWFCWIALLLLTCFGELGRLYASTSQVTQPVLCLVHWPCALRCIVLCCVAGDRTKEALVAFADSLVPSAGQPYLKHSQLQAAPKTSGCNVAGMHSITSLHALLVYLN